MTKSNRKKVTISPQNKPTADGPRNNVVSTETPSGQEEVAEFQSKDRIDLLLKIIGRWDFYINSTNAKASLIIAWNGIVLGTLLLRYNEIIQLYALNWPRYVAIGLVALIGIASMISNACIFNVVFPFLEPSSKKKEDTGATDESILFFLTVAAMGAERFTNRISSSSPEEFIKDISDQGVALAQGLSKKMQTLRRSIRYIYCELILLVCLLILLAAVSWIR